MNHLIAHYLRIDICKYNKNHQLETILKEWVMKGTETLVGSLYNGQKALSVCALYLNQMGHY